MAPAIESSIEGSTSFIDTTAGPVRGPLQAAPPPFSSITTSSFTFPAPTNPRSPFTNLSSSSWAVAPSLFASPAHAAQGEDEEGLLLASAPATGENGGTAATSTTSTTPGGDGVSNTDASGEVVGNTDADESSTLEEFRERLRWLNKITTDAQQELDAIAPPPLKSALDSAVKAAKETDVGPALDVTKRVLGDLQEGFSGLFTSAKDFDAATASAQLKARMEKELEARKEIEDAVAAAAAAAASAEAAGKQEAENAKAAIEQQQASAAAAAGAAGVSPAPSPASN